MKKSIILIAILTAKLAYECNAKSSAPQRTLAALFGFFFSMTYLLYYFIRYILLNDKCDRKR